VLAMQAQMLRTMQ
jgi:hypothetical protein